MKLIFAFILALLILLVWLAFRKPMELNFTLDAGALSAQMIVDWLTVLQIRAEYTDGKAHVSAFLWNRRIFFRQHTEGVNTHRELLGVLSLSETCLKTSYGLNAPHLTGILFGAVNLICTLTGVSYLEQTPDFVPLQEFFRAEGSTRLNIGRTAVNLIKRLAAQRKEKRQWIRQT